MAPGPRDRGHDGTQRGLVGVGARAARGGGAARRRGEREVRRAERGAHARQAGPGGRVERFDEVVEERRSRVDGEVARERDAGPQALCRERVRSRGASEGQPGEEH